MLHDASREIHGADQQQPVRALKRGTQAGWIVEIPEPDLRAARREIRELIGSACHEDQSRRLDARERVPGSEAAELA